MSANDNDTLNGPESVGGSTSGETLTGEQDGHSPAAPQQAKNKSNIKFFAIMAVVVVVVLGMGYMAFGHRKHAAPRPAAPAPVVTPAPASPASAAPAPAPAPAAPTLTSPDEAAALLGGATPAQTPSAVTAPTTAPSELPAVLQPASPAGALTAALPAGAPVTPANQLPTDPLASATPAPAPASTSPLLAAAGQPQGAPVAANPLVPSQTPATPGVVPAATPVNPATQNLPSVLAPASTTTVATAIEPAQGAAPAPTAAVSLESRVSDLETRLSNLEAGQARIVDILAHMTPAQKEEAAAPAHVTHHPKRVRKPRVAPENVVKVIPKESPAPVTSSHAKAGVESTSCHLASIVPNRAWTKQPDGTFMTYGVGDRAPNGGIIKTIDPDRGIITDKGKQVCPMVD